MKQSPKLSTLTYFLTYEGVSKSIRTGRLEGEQQMVQLSATRCSCIAILWVSLVSFTAITLCVASERVFIVVVYFVVDSVRKLLDIPLYSESVSRMVKRCVCVCLCVCVCARVHIHPLVLMELCSITPSQSLLSHFGSATDASFQ
jgi:hypothetical protein